MRASTHREVRITADGLLAAALSFLPLLGFGQSARELPSFEVASVKPSRPGGGNPHMVPSTGGFSAENVTVKMLMRAAFRVDESSIVGGSRWLDSDRYDVAATTGQRTSEDQLRWMLERLLSDRFQLRVHRQSKSGAAYALAIANQRRPNLQVADSTACASLAKPCGGFRRSPYDVTGEKVSMAEFARFLSSVTGVPVTDRTGLSGIFNVRLHAQMAGEPGGAGAKESSGPAEDVNAPPIFTALVEQLGLKLERTKGSTECVVVDSAKRPSEN